MIEARATCGLSFFLALAFFVFSALFAVNLAAAHPVPRESHDRVLGVRLTARAVVVQYHLEIDQWTVYNRDLEGTVDFSTLTTDRAVYEAFAKYYAAILAGNLTARLDGQGLPFTCVKWTPAVLPDSLGWDFVFEAPWQPQPGRPHHFTFKEENYLTQAGVVDLSLARDDQVKVLRQTAPDEALKKRAVIAQRAGDYDLLRQASATFEIPAAAMATPESPPTPAAPAEPATAPASHGLLRLLLDSQRGFWMLLGLAAFFGAAHALTPGHGKTLVAAYLVGEQGTAWHACVLGLVTTLTHTGAVLALAAGLRLFFPKAVPADVQLLLGVGGGLLVAGLGFWLLLRRLSGRADHVHLGGHGRHHQHGHGGADHYHDEHGHVHMLPPSEQRVGMGGLVVMGVTGGIVPCGDAILMLGFAISAQRLWLALPLLLAFSAGLAGVLVLIGIGVVYAKGFAAARWGESRLVRSLPVVSALCVTVLGLWLCYESLHHGV